MSDKSTSQDIILEQLQCSRSEAQPDELNIKGISRGLDEEEYAPLLHKTTTYKLPPGMEKHHLPPVSLMFIHTEQNKRAAIRKAYTDDSESPYINIQMLVDFPSDFPIKDVITLWHTYFWRSQDAKVVKERNPSGITSTFLKDISLKTLKEKYVKYHFTIDPSEFAQNALYFPFILQSYLLQQAYREQHPTVPYIPRILIVAPAQRVAYFISVLSKLLPQQLLHNITFNTYEHDLQNQKYDICGTDPHFIEENENDNQPLLDLYIDDFVLNISETKLESIPARLSSDGLISPTLLERIVRYANFAAKSFSYNKIKADMLENFLRFMAFPKFPDLTVEAFLDEYDQWFPAGIHTGSSIPVKQEATATETVIPKNKQPGQKKTQQKGVMEKIEPPQEVSSQDQEIQSQTEIDITETPLQGIPSGQTPEYTRTLRREEIVEAFKNTETAEQLLEDADARSQIIDFMLHDPAWVQKDLSVLIASLQTYSSDALKKLIWNVNDNALVAVQRGNKQAFDETYRVLMAISPRKIDSPFWHAFLKGFLEEDPGKIFIKQYRDVQEILIDLASEVLRPRNYDDEELMFILIRSSIELGGLHTLLNAPRHGTGLSGGDQANPLRFIPGWNYLLMRQLTYTKTGKLEPKILACLEQYHNNVRILFKEIVELPEHSYSNKWKTLQEFFDMLVNNQYHYISDFFREITELPEDSYPKKWGILQSFFDILARGRYSDTERTDILFKTLEDQPPPPDIAENLLTTNLSGIRTLKPAQDQWLFEHYDLLCIKLSSTSPVLWNITRTMLALPDNILKWEYMLNLALMFNKSQDWTKNHREEIAVLLYACIDSPIRLGMLLSLFIDKFSMPTVNEIVASLGAYASNSMKSLEKEEGGTQKNKAMVERGKRCFALYVQFALHLISIQDDPTRNSYGNILLSNMLKDKDQQIVDFITDEAKFWLPLSLGRQWEVQKKLYSQPRPKSPPVNAAPPPMPPIASPPGNETETSISLPKEPDQEKEKKMLEKLEALRKKEGAGRWATFRIKNYAILQNMKKRQLASDKIQQLELAYEFFLACKEAAHASAPSWALENAIVESSTKIRNNGNIPPFDKKEHKRIKLAHQRSAKLLHSENQKGKV